MHPHLRKLVLEGLKKIYVQNHETVLFNFL